MNLSRKTLYAAGEPLGDCATRRKPGGGYVCGGGGGSSSQSNPNTTNTDNRSVSSIDNTDNSIRNSTTVSTNIADSRSSSWSDSSSTSYIDNSNSSDAVIALAKAGADIIKNSGGAVVELGKFQGEQNTEAWNTTITAGASLIDKLIDKSTEGLGLAGKVVDSFTPTENINADASKYAMWAAAAVAALVLLKGAK